MPHLEKLMDLEKLVGEFQVSNTQSLSIEPSYQENRLFYSNLYYNSIIFVIHFRFIRHYMTICTHAAYRMAGKVLMSRPYSEAVLKSRQGADTGSGRVHGKLRTCQHRAVQAQRCQIQLQMTGHFGSQSG